MKNEITIYELFGLVKDTKAPDKVKYDDVIYIFDGCNYVSHEDECLFTEILMNASDIEFLNEKVEVLVEKNDEKKNLVDLGIKDDEPIGFKFDTNLNRPVLARRCDNYYYAYPSLTGWVYYRSRYLGDKDKEIIDIKFDEWAYRIVKTLEQEFKQKNKNNEWENIEECHSGEGLAFNETALEYKINQLIKNQKYLKEKLEEKQNERILI